LFIYSLESLDLTKTLCENLRGKFVLEFPTLVVTNKDTERTSQAPVPPDEQPNEQSLVPQQTNDALVDLVSDASDCEDGELMEPISSLQLIAQQYAD